jgi:hypothetical protein
MPFRASHFAVEARAGFNDNSDGHSLPAPARRYASPIYWPGAIRDLAKHPRWHPRIHDALPRWAISIGRITERQGRPATYIPNAELRKLIG